MNRDAKGVVALGALLALAACNPTPTPSPSPVPPTATAPSTASPTPTFAPTATDSPTPTATEPPEPVTVGLGLREAEREVLTWLDPAGTPRIEWSRYLRRSALGRLEFDALMDQWPSSFEPREPGALADTLVAVDASAAGRRSPVKSTASPGIAATQPARNEVLAIFDAFTGERVIAIALGERGRVAASSIMPIASAPVPKVTYQPSALRTVTPRPTYGGPSPTAFGSMTPTATATPPPPPRVALTLANLPAALRPTFRDYALVPGSWWTWRVTANNGGVRWVSEIVTETVDAAWLEGDAAVIDSHMDVEQLTPERNGDGLATITGPRTRFVTPQMIVWRRQDLSWVTQVTPAPPGSPFAENGVAPEAFISPFRYPGDIGYQVSLAGTPADIEVPAGRFRDCWPVETIMFMSLGAGSSFCPGVGYVSHGDGGGSSFYESSLRAELLRWHRATLPAR